MFRDKLEKQGNWLFRNRSYFPLLIFPVLFIALQEAEVVERIAGKLADDIWDGFCLIIALGGLAIRSLTVGYVSAGTSGRNTKEQIAHVLNTKGMYSIVRHPLYLGNFLIFVGIMLSVQVWWLALISILAFWLYYERIFLAEEAFLLDKFGDAYVEWAKKTPLLIPRIKNWQQPDLEFSFRHVLNREHTTFFLIIGLMTLLDIMGDYFTEGIFELDTGWAILFVFSFVTYVILRTLKKKTKLLNVEGR